MNVLKQRIYSFMVSEDGPTTTEYAVMLALIVLVAIVAIQMLGNKVSGTFTSTSDGLPEM